MSVSALNILKPAQVWLMLRPLRAMRSPPSCLSADENLQSWMWTDFHNNVFQADENCPAASFRMASCNVGLTLLGICRKWEG